MNQFNILFLDFDGVLNTSNFRDLFGSCLNPFLVRNLIELVRECNFRIVLSTAWRDFLDNEKLKKAFSCDGFRNSLSDEEVNFLLERTIGKTEFIKIKGLSFEETRSLEINSFVNDNQLKNWLAIDDLDLANNKFAVKNFVRTDDDVGLSSDLVEKIIKNGKRT